MTNQQAIDLLSNTYFPCGSDSGEAIAKAIEALKANEPRVMTLEELEDWDAPVFFEAIDTDAYYALIETVEPTAGINGEVVLLNVTPGGHYRRVWSGEHYGEIWRCWTSHPTDAQMEATPWNAQK